jgi:hypothetical protein
VLGVPLIAANVLIHVVALNLIGAFLLGNYANIPRKRTASMDFVIVVGVAVVLTISLHALESTIGGAGYVLLGRQARVRLTTTDTAVACYLRKSSAELDSVWPRAMVLAWVD